MAEGRSRVGLSRWRAAPPRSAFRAPASSIGWHGPGPAGPRATAGGRRVRPPAVDALAHRWTARASLASRGEREPSTPTSSSVHRWGCNGLGPTRPGRPRSRDGSSGSRHSAPHDRSARLLLHARPVDAKPAGRLGASLAGDARGPDHVGGARVRARAGRQALLLGRHRARLLRLLGPRAGGLAFGWGQAPAHQRRSGACAR